MTKKHFIQFASLIKTEVIINGTEAAKKMADMVVTVASRNNPRFDRNRFLTACGLE